MSERKRERELEIEKVKKCIRGYENFPKQGILFWDVFSILQNPEVFQILKDLLVETAKNIQPRVDVVAALDSRGFLFGPLIALELKIPFVPLRKKGKLPGNVTSVSYTLEYSHDFLEIQTDSIENGKQVLLVDDLLATGGSLKAACDLLKQIGANIAACLVVIEILDLNGRDKISSNVISLIKYGK